MGLKLQADFNNVERGDNESSGRVTMSSLSIEYYCVDRERVHLDTSPATEPAMTM